MAEGILASQEIVRKAGLLAPLVGHVGDGNWHLMIVLDPNDRWVRFCMLGF
jgi:D-lactate dehydrogenase (cytochrome)